MTIDDICVCHVLGVGGALLVFAVMWWACSGDDDEDEFFVGRNDE